MSQQALSSYFLQLFALPEQTYIGVKVPKKTLTDNTDLTRADKTLVKDVIKSIEYRYSLKPQTVNITTYEDALHEYNEIVIFYVVVKNRAKTKQLCRLLHQSIPYPLILVVVHEQALTLSLADKRINQVDNNKLIIAQQYDTGWLEGELNQHQQAFLEDLVFAKLSKISLYDLYLDLIAAFTRFEAAKITGSYNIVGNVKGGTPTLQPLLKDILEEIKRLEATLNQLRVSIKKEVQMNNKIKLNLQARELKQSIAMLKKQL